MGISKKDIEERNQSIIIAAIVVVILITAIYIFNLLVDERLSLAAENDLKGKSKQQQQIIDEHFASGRSGIIGLADSLNLANYKDENIASYLKMQMENFEFQELYVVGLDGAGISSNSAVKNFEGKDYFEQAASGSFAASKAYESTSTGNETVDLAAPIYGDNEEVEAVLVGEYSLVNIIESLEESMSTEKNSYALILGENGEPLFATKEEYVYLQELNKGKIEDGITIEDMLSDLENDKEGSLTFEYEGVTRIVHYQPLEFSSWCIILVVDEAEILPEVRTIGIVITVSSILAVLMVVGIIIYFLIAKNRQIKNIEKVAYYDDLTGLPNIMGFKRLVKEALKKDPNNNYVMVKFDIENFKAVNEMFGYEVGNQVLKAYKTTSDTVTEPTFILGRTGGDGIIMFAGNGFLEQLDDTRYHFEGIFSKALPVLEKHRLTYRYGRYFIEKGETDVDEIVDKTGMAHSMAKRKKSNKIWNYDDKLKEEVLQLAEITNKMEKALEKEEFVAFLQPKFRLADEKLIGAEALVRWIEEDGNMIFPNDFIPHFEKNGFIVEVDKHVLTVVCKHIRNWIDTGKEAVPVSVNFSRVHVENPDFVDDIIDIVDSYKVPHELIEIELTETTALGNEIEFNKILSGLGKVGIAVSIDDFGAGYSSLGLLKDLKADTLKLDRSFFIGGEEDERGEVLIEGVVNLAHSLGMSTVAEGIEDKKQIDFLTGVGCKTAQGYYYDKPMPIKEFEEKFISKTGE